MIRRAGFWRWLTMALGAVVLMAACNPAEDQVFPTARPTVTATLNPTATPTIVFTKAALAPSPTAASGGGNSAEPTSPIGIIPTGLPPTLTPILAPAVSGSAEIEYFTTDAPSVRPGDKLTLFWSTKGVTQAIIYRLDADGKRAQVFNVGRSGSLEVATNPADRGSVQFTLSIGEAARPVEQTISIPISCTDEWFFNPQPGGCPSTVSIPTAAAEQLFQHGRMIWIETQTRIYVFFNDGKSDSKNPAWTFFPDEFKDGQPESDPSFSAPAGMSQPVRGFGLVWRGNKAVRDRIGWATAPETSYSGMLQGDATVDNGLMYIRTKDGSVLELTNKGESWKLISPQ